MGEKVRIERPEESSEGPRAAARVSVIVITYDRAALLEIALQSVLRQTFEDFELLVVDDRSTDGTQQLVSSLEDPRIRYLRHDHNRGEGGARNTGIAHARGELVAFLDDDDAWHADKLRRQVRCLDSQPPSVAAVYTGLVEVDGQTGAEGRHREARLEGDLLRPLIRRGNFIAPSTILLRRACFDELGSFDEDLPGSLDYDMWIRIAERYRFVAIPAPLVRYRIHRNRMSRNYALHIQGVTALMRKHERYFAGRTPWNSKRHFYLGIWLALEGDLSSARRAFGRSIWSHPIHPKPWVAFSFTFFGAAGFRHLLRWATRSSPGASSYGDSSVGMG